MIRVPYTLTDLDILAESFYKDICAELRLRPLLKTYPNNYLKPVMEYLRKNLHLIMTGQPDQLEKEIVNIQPLINQAVVDYWVGHAAPLNKKGIIVTDPKSLQIHVDKVIKTEIHSIFSYDGKDFSFVKKNKGGMAYRHAKRLEMNTCPYCNANFTFTIKNKRMKCRPQFDHFLNKDRYPYLALSFYNLIPSCALCNSGALKGSKPFSIKTHLHPFLDDIEGLYVFRTKVSAVDFLVNKKDFTLSLKPANGVPLNVRKRAKANIDVFGLQDRYRFHKDIAGDVLQKAYVYNKTAIESLFTSFKIGPDNIFKSTSEIKELVMGNYLHPKHFHIRILSKLTRDIAEEFGLTV